MRVDKAQELRIGDSVFIDYTPNPGHGQRIFCAGKVESVAKEIKRNSYGVEYVWIGVKYGDTRSVFPSFCLGRL